MEINVFVEKFAEQLEETDPSTLSATTNFREIAEWSSLTALGIIAMVDEEFEVELKGDDIRTANTISDLFNIIKGKL